MDKIQEQTRSWRAIGELMSMKNHQIRIVILERMVKDKGEHRMIVPSRAVRLLIPIPVPRHASIPVRKRMMTMTAKRIRTCLNRRRPVPAAPHSFQIAVVVHRRVAVAQMMNPHSPRAPTVTPLMMMIPSISKSFNRGKWKQ